MQKALFEKYAGKMLAVCRRYMVIKADAEDVLQDGFVKIFTHISSLNEENHLEAWMRKIFVTTAISKLRKQKVRMTDEIDSIESVSTENNGINHLENKDLQEIICGLPNGYRVVFNLYAMEGYSHKEIAELLHISENTSRTQYHKARLALQIEISKKNKVNI